MIKGHHSLLLRRLFTPKRNKNKVCPRELNQTKISPKKCLMSKKDRQYCACNRKRKDIQKNIERTVVI